MKHVNKLKDLPYIISKYTDDLKGLLVLSDRHHEQKSNNGLWFKPAIIELQHYIFPDTNVDAGPG